MGFYELTKDERVTYVALLSKELTDDFQTNSTNHIIRYYSDEDTYVRKSAYTATGIIYKSQKKTQKSIIVLLESLFKSDDYKIRQTVINAIGEIGIIHFDKSINLLEKGLVDNHHAIRNAVIGSLKKMGEKNPEPVLCWSAKFINHPDAEIRREICHGLELLGRTHPEAILPLLKTLQFETSQKVRDMLIHVIGQISYKGGCLAKVIEHLNQWKNKELVKECVIEIIEVHKSYSNFAIMSAEEASEYISGNLID